jgi:hypothetical protein
MSKRQSKSQARPRKKSAVTSQTVRSIALALPQVEEALSHGAPVFRVRGKLMAHLHEDENSLLIKIDYLKRDILINAEPETFYVTDFYRCYPTVFVRLSNVDRRVLESLLEEAWRLVAPKRLVAAHDGKSNG